MLKLTSRWNRLYAVLAVVSTFSIFSCQKASLTPESPEAQLNKKAAVSAQAGATIATLNWDQTYQKIDGFGAFGGRIVPFFESAKRDSILDYLWGGSGLKLNILRGKVLHTYPFNH